LRLFCGDGAKIHARLGDRPGRCWRRRDPHSPGQFRANGSLRNQGAFADAFEVKPGDAMYLTPEQRISLWQVDREVVCKENSR
jgi:putative endopeptidase